MFNFFKKASVVTKEKEHSNADEIRKYAKTHFITPARQRGDKSVVFSASDIHAGMKENTLMASICSASSAGFASPGSMPSAKYWRALCRFLRASASPTSMTQILAGEKKRHRTNDEHVKKQITPPTAKRRHLVTRGHAMSRRAASTRGNAPMAQASPPRTCTRGFPTRPLSSRRGSPGSPNAPAPRGRPR